MSRHPLAALLVFIGAALAVAPLLSLVQIAAQGDNEVWANFITHVFKIALFNTVSLLAGVAVISVVAGVGTAWIVTAFDFPGRNALIWLLPLPLAFPTYIVAYVYVDLLDGVGPVQTALRALFGWHTAADYWFPNIRTLGGAIFVMGFVLYPYIYLAARAMFQTQSIAMIEIARSLGAGRLRAMWDINLPLARPAVAAGLSLALLEALNDIGASEYLGVRTLTISIFTTWLNRSSLPGAAQIACLMLIGVAVLIALERYARRRQAFVGHDRRPGDVQRIPIRGGGRWVATVACSVPVALGFVVPLSHLAYEVATRGLIIGFDTALIRHVFSTVWIAAVATAATIALGFGLVFALRLIERPWATVGVFVASLGYAIPGTVLALGLLSPLVLLDEGINAITDAAAGVNVGLILAGSSAAVIIAYTVRFLAIATGMAQAGLARISTELDDAARSGGAKPTAVLTTIHLPLLKPALWGAALLVFVDCLKELPATLLLRPLNVETLSTYIYQFAARGSFEEGALAALLIVLVGILPVIRMVRHADSIVDTRAAPRPHPPRPGTRAA
jgi:iron(III) transport system permease protein